MSSPHCSVRKWTTGCKVDQSERIIVHDGFSVDGSASLRRPILVRAMSSALALVILSWPLRYSQASIGFLYSSRFPRIAGSTHWGRRVWARRTFLSLSFHFSLSILYWVMLVPSVLKAAGVVGAEMMSRSWSHIVGKRRFHQGCQMLPGSNSSVAPYRVQR